MIIEFKPIIWITDWAFNPNSIEVTINGINQGGIYGFMGSPNLKFKKLDDEYKYEYSETWTAGSNGCYGYYLQRYQDRIISRSKNGLIRKVTV